VHLASVVKFGFGDLGTLCVEQFMININTKHQINTFRHVAVDKIVLNERMTIGKYEEGNGHDHNLRHCLDSGIEGLRKTMQNLIHFSWPPGLDLIIQGLLSVTEER
jgi:hypothetical protein